MAGPTATLASASFACTPVKRFEFFRRTSKDIQCTVTSGASMQHQGSSCLVWSCLVWIGTRTRSCGEPAWCARHRADSEKFDHRKARARRNEGVYEVRPRASPER